MYFLVPPLDCGFFLISRSFCSTKKIESALPFGLQLNEWAPLPRSTLVEFSWHERGRQVTATPPFNAAVTFTEGLPRVSQLQCCAAIYHEWGHFSLLLCQVHAVSRAFKLNQLGQKSGLHIGMQRLCRSKRVTHTEAKLMRWMTPWTQAQENSLVSMNCFLAQNS